MASPGQQSGERREEKMEVHQIQTERKLQETHKPQHSQTLDNQRLRVEEKGIPGTPEMILVRSSNSPRPSTSTSDKRVYTIKHRSISVKFECDSRYTPLESIGTGAYGVVCAAKDNRTGRKVAIKKIPRAFDEVITAKRTYRELKILRHLRHENVISILDVMEPPENESNLQDVYVILDLMETDLHHIIHSVQPLSDDHIKYFLYQIGRGLKYIHSANIIHRDLKPSNLLINRNCELKIGDFGMARGLSSTPEDHALFLTEYVATRWYRAPELMLSFSQYNISLDIWSVGCIFAEMLGRRQIFPGKNYVNQLQLVLSVVGTPSDEYINNIGSERVKMYLKSLPKKQPVDLFVLFPKANKVALELLEKLLQLDPSKRYSAVEILGHPYLSLYHDTTDEPICTPPFDFTFEKTLDTKELLRSAVVDELKEYHKCRIPIPPTNQVRDALKKMMEEREQKSSEGGEPEKREQKEVAAVKKKRLDERKRRTPDHQIHGPEKPKKKQKVYSPLTDSDRTALEHWNKLAVAVSNTTKKKGQETEEILSLQQQQELLIKQQSEQLEKQQKQMVEQQRRIQQQSEQIKQLVHHQKVLIRECKAAGIKIPLSTPNPSPLSQAGLVSSPLTNASITTVKLTPPVQPHPLPVVKPHPFPVQPHPPPFDPGSLIRTDVPVSPVNNSTATNPQSSIPPATAAHAINYQNQPPVVAPPPTVATPAAIAPPTSSITYPLPVPSYSTMLPTDSYPPHGPPLPLPHSPPDFMSSYIPVLPAQPSVLPPDHSVPYCGPPAEFFSPLTSKELVELTSQEMRKLSPYIPQSIDSFVPPLQEDLEKMFNVPPGGTFGGGYGVGISDDELTVTVPDNKIEGPPSASLLQEWLQDIDDIDSQGLQALQQEMEFGSSEMFFRELEKL